jgi:hypothetical protein
VTLGRENVSLSEEEIALLQSDPAARRGFYAEHQHKCIKSLHITSDWHGVGQQSLHFQCSASSARESDESNSRGFGEGGRVDLSAKEGRLVPRILSFDGDNVHRALLQRIFQVVLQLELYDPGRRLCSQPGLIEQMAIAGETEMAVLSGSHHQLKCWRNLVGEDQPPFSIHVRGQSIYLLQLAAIRVRGHS